VSITRIRKLLKETPPRSGPSVLKLEYHVEVVAAAPKIFFFEEFKLHPGSGVPYGGMTHREFLQMVGRWRK